MTDINQRRKKSTVNHFGLGTFGKVFLGWGSDNYIKIHTTGQYNIYNYELKRLGTYEHKINIDRIS